MKTDNTITSKPKTIRFKIIRPVFETLKIEEHVPEYLARSRKITSSQDVFDLFRYLGNETKEHFIALHLDSKNKILCVDICSVGSLNASITHPREIYKSCLLSSCAAVLFIHNHPSSDCTPSKEDIEITSRLKDGADLLGLRLLDHIIIGDGSYVSLADRGLLS